MIVGLTGGVASGKSTVARLFAERGVPVIDLDQVARDVVAPGTPLLARVIERFGPKVRQADGSLDRRALRHRVFAHPEERRELEGLLHPAILRRTAELVATAGGPYQIIVNPLLAEMDAPGRYDRVLVVDCETTVQRARLGQRDGSRPEEIAGILAAQTTREHRLQLADDVIVNDADLAALVPKVAALHERYLRLAAAPAAEP
jgi:dephospho-CoA kinase